ncbi:DUF1816 domain-containing protein [Altericista sp. CCNU0014]|uniref:DUF1816 domain-containing protein n=1 Tax=Altericista sp. CCNU0014 TaxID=3082949 RepID=UPI00384EBB61
MNVTLSTPATIPHHRHKTENSELRWWLEMRTINPICIYFFGPFETRSEAESSQSGFFQDLESEDAWVLYSTVKLSNPHHLTIDADALTLDDLRFFQDGVLPDSLGS